MLADAIVAHLEPIQNRYKEVREDDDYLDSVLRDGAAEARKIASQTLKTAQVAMGFALRKD